MSVDEQVIPPYLTDAEWREFQAIPDQGYSHRQWIDYRIHLRVEQAKREAAADALDEASDSCVAYMTKRMLHDRATHIRKAATS